MKYLLIIPIIFAVGCKDTLSPELEIKRGEARHAVFVECMELAAKMPRSTDDDVSDIIDACANQSFYITKYLTRIEK